MGDGYWWFVRGERLEVREQARSKQLLKSLLPKDIATLVDVT